MKQEISRSELINHNDALTTTTATTPDTNIATTIATTNVTATRPPIDGEIIKKKKKGPFGFFKSALIKLRPRPVDVQKPKPEKDSSGQEKWKKIVGSMRPLHLQDTQSPPPSVAPISRSSTVENFEDLMSSSSSTPISPAPSFSTFSDGTMSSYASSSNLQDLDKQSGTMSSYASAQNLQELDKYYANDDENESDPDEVFDSLQGDEMIDDKATKFIAQFYLQMKLQQQVTGSKNYRGKDKM